MSRKVKHVTKSHTNTLNELLKKSNFYELKTLIANKPALGIAAAAFGEVVPIAIGKPKLLA